MNTIGESQRIKLEEVLGEFRELRKNFVINDDGIPHNIARKVCDIVSKLQVLAEPFLSPRNMRKLNLIILVNLNDFSVNKAWAKLQAIVPIIEDALASFSRLPTAPMLSSLEYLLQVRKLDAVSDHVKRALRHVESDPPTAITASRAALESLFKTYLDDKGISIQNQNRAKTGKLLWTALKDLGLDLADDANRDLRQMLQGLSSVVDGIAAFRTHGGSAHGHGRHHNSPSARHARFAVQSSLAIVEFFVSTWNYRENSSLSS